MKIGFVGLGQMGAGMARNLVRAGHSVTVYNRTREKAQALAADGAKIAKSIADACAGADICWSMVADDAALHATAIDTGGIADCLPRDATHLSSSTVSVAIVQSLTKLHAERGQRFLSAPVFGRPDAAEAKRLIAVVAGQADLIAQLRPVLDDISRAVFVAGSEPWQANLFKLCGNFTLASMLEALGEAFATIQKSGADQHVFYDVMNELYGSPIYKNYGALIVDRKFEPPAFLLRLGLKDIRLALEAAEALDVPMPFASVVRDQMLSGLARGQEKLDWSSLGIVAAKNAGITFD